MRTKLSVLPVLLALALAPAAHAKKVTGLTPWKPSNHYLVEVDLDGRAQPKLKPVAKVDHLRQGQWVRITCQTTGQAAYGSNLWDKVAGLYVPDHFIKTYTDGPIPGAPRCDGNPPAPPAPQPPPKPAGPTRAQLFAAANAVEYETVGGPNYAKYKAMYPNNGLIWDHNGCSVPEKLLTIHTGPIPLGKTLGYYSNLFEAACNRHDFGYRNYGSATSGGLKLDPTESRRDSIDSQLHHNMDDVCDTHFHHKYLQLAQREACRKASDVFYWAVAHFAQKHYFG
jgi:hypothetical protein